MASDDLLARPPRPPPPSPAAVSQADTGCVFGRPSASCLTSSCSLCSDSARPCLGPGPKVEPAPRSVDPQLQLRDGRFVCLRSNAPPSTSLKMGWTVGCLRLRWQETEHVSGGNWHQTHFETTQKKVILSAIAIVWKSVVPQERRGVFVWLQARSQGAKHAVFCGTAKLLDHKSCTSALLKSEM